MSSWSTSKPDCESKEQVAIDLIWALLGRSYVLPDLITQWFYINTVSVLENLTRAQDEAAGPMPPGFEDFLRKDLSDLTLFKGMDLAAARYMPALNVEQHLETWINIIHSFLVVYTGYKHPHSSCRQNRRLDAINQNI